MKKFFIILLIILLILLLGVGVFYFFGNGKQTFNNFFQDNTFGSFFDTEPQSRNDFTNPPTDTPTESTTQTNYVAPVLRQISLEPISGYTTYATTSTSTRSSLNSEGFELVEEFIATSTVVRFQERATGHIYDVFEFLQAPQKVSPITEQKIYKAQFSSNKDRLIYQTLISNNEQIKTTLGQLVFSTATDVFLNKTELSSVISDFILDKTSDTLIYSVKQNGLSTIYTSNIDRSNEKIIKNIYFNDFIIDIINSKEALITTKASALAPGYVYSLNLTNGSFNKLLGDIPGLIAKVSFDKKYYIYSQSEQGRPAVRLFDTTNNTVSLLTFDTLPSEKCVFSKKEAFAYCFGSPLYKLAQYPDDWYKGKILNYEALYKINLVDGSVSVVYNFQTEDLNIDALEIQLTQDDQMILFQNKYDLTLWSLNLNKLSNELY